MSIGSANPHRPMPPNQPDGTRQTRRYNADQVIPLILKSLAVASGERRAIGQRVARHFVNGGIADHDAQVVFALVKK